MMKRTVEITPRYQPVIDYYKGYTNAEFNVLINSLLGSYKMFKQEKNLDLLMLIECLKGYNVSLPELMIILAEKFENIPQEKIKELEQSNLNKEKTDNIKKKEKKISNSNIIKPKTINQPLTQQENFYNNQQYVPMTQDNTVNIPVVNTHTSNIEYAQPINDDILVERFLKSKRKFSILDTGIDLSD